MITNIEEQEIWGFPGYTINNLGQVHGPNGPLKLYNYNKGKHRRQTIQLNNRKDNRKQTLSIARLVAEYFLPNTEGYRYVMHKDGDRFNNKVTNLEWTRGPYRSTKNS